MTNKTYWRNYLLSYWTWSAVLGLYLTATYEYLLFHSIIEMLSVATGFTIFSIGWHSRKFSQNSFYSILAASYLVVSVVDLLHTLSYPGMGLFLSYDTNLSIALWTTARYLEGLGLVFACLWVARKKVISISQALGLYLPIGVILVTLALLDVYPLFFIEGEGLTSFKVVNGYIIAGIFLVAGLYIFKHRAGKADSKTLLAAAAVVTAASEIAFTRYYDPFSLFNFLGHVLKFISFLFIYRALVIEVLKSPYERLFMKQQAANNELEISRKRYYNLFNKIQEGYVLVRVEKDPSGELDFRVVDHNPAFLRLCQTTDSWLADIAKPKGDKVLRGMRHVVLTGEPYRSADTYCALLDKHFEFIMYRPEPMHVAILVVDNTETRRIQQREHDLQQSTIDLLREQRHDVLNELAIMSTYTQMGRFDRVQQCIDYMSANLSYDLEFPALPADAWKAVLEAKRQQAEDLGIRWKADLKAPPPVGINEQRLLPKLIMNFVDNAFDALKDVTDPWINVSWSKSDQFRELSVENKGGPIPPEVRQRLFTPGYSTKAQGRGWGLLICQKVAQELGGEIAIESSARSTCFRFRLPVSYGSVMKRSIES